MLLPRSTRRSRARWGGRLATIAITVSALATACGDDDSQTTGGTGADGPNGPLVVTPAPGGMRRLTTAQMVNGLEDVLGPGPAQLIPAARDPQLRGFEGIWAAEIAFNANEVSGLESKLTEIVDAALAQPGTLASIAPCVSAPTESCFTDVAAKVGRLAWRRSLAADEVQRLTGIAQAGKTWAEGQGLDGPKTGLRYELLAIFQSPNFLYIAEIGEADAESGHRKLTQVELASRMSYFLTNRAPDMTLLDAAENGGLATADAVRGQATRLIQSQAARVAMRRFFNELYLIRDLANTEKDPALFPEYSTALAGKLQEQMLLFIEDIIWTRNGDARDLFDSPDMFVDATLAAFYSVNAPSSGFAKITTPPDQKRAGILGHAAYLARFAHPGMTSPTRRGRFIQERLMCRPMDPPPPGQNIDLPDEVPGVPMTMRQKLTQHIAGGGNCSGCHGLMDPLGFALENFDAVGKYRADDRGLPLDTTGITHDLGSFDGPLQLGKAIRESEDATTCIVRNFLRSGLAHVETAGEEDAVLALEKTFAERGYKIQDLLVEFTVSPAFQLVGEPK